MIEDLYPPQSAQSWDQVGLVTGDLAQPVRHLHLALDPTLGVIQQCRGLGVDLLLTHHPLLLRGVHSVATTTAKGASVTDLVVGDIALYVAHTNADVAATGVNQALARALDLREVSALVEEEGQPLGRRGQLREPMSLAELACRVHAVLPEAPAGIRVAGEPSAMVRTLAVMGGAGDGQIAAARAAGVDVYLTADLRHHPALEAREEARHGPPYLIDVGHWSSESIWLPLARDAILAALPRAGITPDSVEVSISSLCTDPWDFVIGARPPSSGGMP